MRNFGNGKLQKMWIEKKAAFMNLDARNIFCRDSIQKTLTGLQIIFLMMLSKEEVETWGLLQKWNGFIGLFQVHFASTIVLIFVFIAYF